MVNNKITPMMQAELFVVLTVVVICISGGAILLNGHNRDDSIRYNLVEKPGEKEFFSNGGAEIKASLRSRLIKVVNDLSVESIEGYDTIEVIGHTDGVKYWDCVENLTSSETYSDEYGNEKESRKCRRVRNEGINIDDEVLKLSSNERSKINGFEAASNIELGLLRAANVAHFFQRLRCEETSECSLSKLSEESTYSGIKQLLPESIKYIRFYSAGQNILPDGSLAKASDPNEIDSTRRRIEIRLTNYANRNEVSVSN